MNEKEWFSDFPYADNKPWYLWQGLRQNNVEGVALQPATPAVCNAPENNMQS